ncbi:head-tail connector protein [Pontibaca methylaminivorans]|uniref:Phage gp6-like head-tail connector protein n=1 Tax=Pontibaca methylaminivorans TaxID=515897 RepID=A0A1R3WV26_9RHOB|nr:hypothetical protein [Pontibaca methylaminivorans]SIT81859.1 phage conserved hypothetical protein, phiE125 gp8 family [Pontibaca methylaminivorans]
MITQRLERPLSGILDPAELLDHVRGTDDDLPALTRMAIAAAGDFEDYAQVALRRQAVRVTWNAWPHSGSLKLPVWPLVLPQSVTLEIAGVEVEDFETIDGRRPELTLTGPRPRGPVLVEYIAGFGESGTDVPEDIRHALLDQVAAYFDARGAADRQTVTLSPHFARLLARYRGVRA